MLFKDGDPHADPGLEGRSPGLGLPVKFKERRGVLGVDDPAFPRGDFRTAGEAVGVVPTRDATRRANGSSMLKLAPAMVGDGGAHPSVYKH